MRVWIDMANSPHPLLFAPIARRLTQLDHAVLVTVRDNAQTLELCRERWTGSAVIGGPSPSGRLAKAANFLARARRLAAWGRAVRPDVALSHNSYAQIAAARALGVRTVTAMDFEHQPANHIGFRLADTVLLPSAMSGPAVRRKGATPRKARFYDGLKEELYLGDFEPDPDILERIGVERAPGDAVVVMRTPPSRALYHRFGNPLFDGALRTLGAQPHVHCVVLTRHPEQRTAIAAMGLANLVLPDSAIDARSLMRAADLVVGAGGTMTREAALLGVPTLTVFAGREPAVDRALMERGLLRRLSSPQELAAIRPRASHPQDVRALRARSERLVDMFVEATVDAGGRSRRPVAETAAHG